MSLMNQMGNAKNPFQTQAKRVLCLCSAGLLRSPTAANVLHAKYGYNTRCAGVSEEYALIPVNEVLIFWADEIVCVNLETFLTLKSGPHESFLFGKKIVVLDIPDNYSWNDENLRKEIEVQYEKSKETKSS